MLKQEKCEFSEKVVQTLPFALIPEYSPRAALSKMKSQQESNSAKLQTKRAGYDLEPFLRSSSKTSPRDDPASRMISRHFVSRHSSETDPALGDQMQYSTTSTHGARVPQACCVNNNLRTTIVP